tara:strand:- start:718 stop:1266 length:549 start_codon:yes stop_codon:yes gene_type:complete
MSKKNNKYTIDQHSHRFAVWTAARAATRGMKGGTTQNVEKAIRDSDLQSFVEIENIDTPISSFDVYKEHHDKYCKKIIKCFKDIGIPCTYGRAAKIIAIYIKTRILNIEDHRLMNFAFPPIDSILLENLAKEYPTLKDLKKVKWTQLESKKYNDIIARLNNEWCMKKQKKMWEIEDYWNPER